MLTASDFSDFFKEVHGWCPFPWQTALVERVVAEGEWPEVVDVPTGLGKTAMLDAAVYVAAVKPLLGRRRIFFVVDRRLVVDEAYRHARKLRRVLEAASPDSVAGAVARSLRVRCEEQSNDDRSVLEAARMRGGVTWDARWLQRPDQYAIVTGTVDQIGSRLLFRGYGVTEQARSIDAALVGTDSLIVVDEAHLARPFVETVSQLGQLDPRILGAPPRVVTMSATTQRAGGEQVHTISEADEQHPVARTRLRAPKRLRLVEVKASRDNASTAVADALARMAMAHANSGKVVGVVVNTVARARAVFDRIATRVDALLLTGRSRPIDRDYLLGTYYGRLQVGRQRSGEPLVLVATQTIEVGANVDFDALVTESAPLDALIQRLGRLNRLGEIPEPGAPALVVHDASLSDDPVYGESRSATWQWLCSWIDPVKYTARLDPSALTGGIDSSPAALREMTLSRPAELIPQPDYVPVLSAQTLDAWVRTSPAPHPDPPVAPYLHGLTDAKPGVRIVWRAGLYGADRRDWKSLIEAVPPTADEEIEVSRTAVRRWLEEGGTDPLLGDLDTETETTEEIEERQLKPLNRIRDDRGRPLVLRVRGRDNATTIASSAIIPGDLIVVPTEYGGCDRFGWNPASPAPVVDVADLASRRGRPVLRLGQYLKTVVRAYHPDLADSPALDELLGAVEEDADEGALAPERYREALRALVTNDSEDGGDADRLPLIRNLAIHSDSMRARASLWEQGGPWRALLTRRGVGLADDRSPTGSSATGRRIALDSHQAEVEQKARAFACNLGLSERVVESAALAAKLHDEGKRDPRFQAMLWGGDHRKAQIASQLIAKSGMSPGDRAAHRRASRLAGYPSGMRHEALSAQIAALSVAQHDGVDSDLVLHLVAAHHGYGRPLLPPVVDQSPQKVTVGGHVLSTEHTVDWDGPARFAKLNRQYGRWGLALLETVVRLADIWCSARDLGEETTDAPD